MKAVFFKSTIPIEIYSENEEGKLERKTIMRHMEQGEVVEVVEYDEGSMMMFTEGAIWWVPDKTLFNIVNYQNSQSTKCCG